MKRAYCYENETSVQVSSSMGAKIKQLKKHATSYTSETKIGDINKL